MTATKQDLTMTAPNGDTIAVPAPEIHYAWEAFTGADTTLRLMFAGPERPEFVLFEDENGVRKAQITKPAVLVFNGDATLPCEVVPLSVAAKYGEVRGDENGHKLVIDFPGAIRALKEGARVARKGWNGKGMFLFLVNGSTFKVNREPLLSIMGEGTEVQYHAHIDMKTAQGYVVPWLASQADMLAEDWYFVNGEG